MDCLQLYRGGGGEVEESTKRANVCMSYKVQELPTIQAYTVKELK